MLRKLANSEQIKETDEKILNLLVSIKNKKNNCYFKALALAEMLSYCGFYTRTVRCLPIGTFPYDNHCVTAIYLNSVNRWITVDPTYNLFFKDNDGVYLSLSEMREKLIQGQKINVNTSFNTHGRPIVNSPREALIEFEKEKGIDILVIGNYYIER